MGAIAMIVTVCVLFGVGYSYLRWYWDGDERLNSELFD